MTRSTVSALLAALLCACAPEPAPSAPAAIAAEAGAPGESCRERESVDFLVWVRVIRDGEVVPCDGSIRGYVEGVGEIEPECARGIDLDRWGWATFLRYDAPPFAHRLYLESSSGALLNPDAYVEVSQNCETTAHDLVDAVVVSEGGAR